MWYNPTTNTQAITHSEIRSANPQASMPTTLTDANIEYVGFYLLKAIPPVYDSVTQRVQAITPVLTGLGTWEQRWSVLDKFSDTTDEDGVVTTKAEHETAHTASLVAAKEASVRTDRDSRIALTDWTALSDVTMSAEMTTYRQALRDITAHANFPDLETEDWPTSP